MEIERKYLIKSLPQLDPYKYRDLEQAYLCTKPVVRVRKEEDTYYLTYKGSGLLEREEYNLPLTKDSYEHLKAKADGNIIQKRRYLIPLEGGLLGELDVFQGMFQGLQMIEVEFASREAADRFLPPEWFGEEVTFDPRYHNSYMSSHKIIELKDL